MNLSRCILLVLSAFLLAKSNPTVAKSIADSNAKTALPNSTFQDWAGVLSEVDLPDGSVLFEYSARSFSGRTEGGMLAITFVPRFKCAPTITVRVPDADAGELRPADASLLVQVGGDQKIHKVVADRQEGYINYAIMASVGELRKLRETFDTSSRVWISLVDDDLQLDEKSADFIDDPGSPMDQSEDLAFSLLGSRLSTREVDKHCQTHKPVPYKSK